MGIRVPKAKPVHLELVRTNEAKRRRSWQARALTRPQRVIRFIQSCRALRVTARAGDVTPGWCEMGRQTCPKGGPVGVPLARFSERSWMPAPAPELGEALARPWPWARRPCRWALFYCPRELLQQVLQQWRQKLGNALLLGASLGRSLRQAG
jgi:hypothetical protein